ncbi:hypothetical protein JCM8097_007996 [Rhodosporidiobolus ruineniae]
MASTSTAPAPADSSSVSFSFMQILQLVQPVSPSSPYRLPAVGKGHLLPSRFAKSTAPFTVPPPTNLDALYQQARANQDPEAARRERNRKKKERKLRSLERKEAGAATAVSEGAEGADGEAAVASTSAAPEGPAYGLPADIPQPLFDQFSARYADFYKIATEQRETMWNRMVAGADADAATALKELQFGNVILHDAALLPKGEKKQEGMAGVAGARDGTVELHWMM